MNKTLTDFASYFFVLVFQIHLAKKIIIIIIKYSVKLKSFSVPLQIARKQKQSNL